MWSACYRLEDNMWEKFCTSARIRPLLSTGSKLTMITLVRTVIFAFGFCSALYRVGFGSFQILAIFLLNLGFRFGLVLRKTWVLVRFVLTGFVFFPISGCN